MKESVTPSPWRILDAYDAPQLVLDRAGRIVYANVQLCRLLDVAADQLHGRPWFESIVAPTARDTAEADFPALSRARRARTLHYPLPGPAGTGVVQAWRWTRIPGHLGLPGAFLLAACSAATSVAPETHAHAEDEQGLLAPLFSSANVMFAYLDRGLRFIRVNEAFATYHQREPEAMIGQAFARFHPEPSLSVLLSDVIKHGKPRRLEVQLHHGFAIDSDWSVQPVVNADGDAEGVLLSILDITERMQIRKRLEQTNSLLKGALSGTVEAISRAEEARDPYTAGHQRRVAQLSVAIARQLGLDEERVEGIRLGALIHDIGKIQTPAELLSKPTALSPFEYAIVQQHALIGFDILKDIPFPWPIAQIAYQHHERMDGSGYPQGLRGDDILIESRIVAVADVVEAMGYHRPYRPAMGMEKALAELRKHRGQRYDASVVDACLRLFAEDRFSFTS